METELLSRARCQELFATAESEARRLGVADIEVLFSAGSEALTRFANNTIHQNVAERQLQLSVRTQQDQRTARAETNRLDQDSIHRAVAAAVASMRAQQPDDRLLPLADSACYPDLPRYRESTARCGPRERATRVAEAIAIAEQAGLNAAGIFSSGEFVAALHNSRGISAYHAETLARFSITVMGGSSSGWAKGSSSDADSVPVGALAESAVRKALMSADPRELPPGRYTVILEPAATLDLAGQMFADFSGTALEDQRSFLTGRLGQKLFGDNVTIHDDVFHSLQTGPPFDGEGVPRQRVTLVEAGVPKEVVWSRGAAQRSGKTPTGHGLPLPNEYGELPINLVFEGGEASVDEMIASTERGILVTRLWYIREVDPYSKLMTGMTRDGTFLVEGGKVVAGVRNFRFNQGLIDMLRNIEMLGPAVRACGEEAIDMVAPAMKVHDFQFSEVTRF